jgi:hypothetical protein
VPPPVVVDPPTLAPAPLEPSVPLAPAPPAPIDPVVPVPLVPAPMRPVVPVVLLFVLPIVREPLIPGPLRAPRSGLLPTERPLDVVDMSVRVVVLLPLIWSAPPLR